MNVETKLRNKKKDLEALQAEKIRTEGKAEQGMENLKAKGFDSIEAAKEEQARRIKEKEEIIQHGEELNDRLGEKYKDFIE